MLCSVSNPHRFSRLQSLWKAPADLVIKHLLVVNAPVAIRARRAAEPARRGGTQISKLKDSTASEGSEHTQTYCSFEGCAKNAFAASSKGLKFLSAHANLTACTLSKAWYKSSTVLRQAGVSKMRRSLTSGKYDDEIYGTESGILAMILTRHCTHQPKFVSVVKAWKTISYHLKLLVNGVEWSLLERLAVVAHRPSTCWLTAQTQYLLADRCSCW